MYIYVYVEGISSLLVEETRDTIYVLPMIS